MIFSWFIVPWHDNPCVFMRMRDVATVSFIMDKQGLLLSCSHVYCMYLHENAQKLYSYSRAFLQANLVPPITYVSTSLITSINKSLDKKTVETSILFYTDQLQVSRII